MPQPEGKFIQPVCQNKTKKFPFLSTKRGSKGTGSSQTQRVISKKVKKKFQKGGLNGSKKDFFEKIFPKLKRA